ncbi:hypothetical protein AgCh_031197 [Apium graveolens]
MDVKVDLKQHNGELKGGAKASRAGRPWVCACLVQGFMDKSKDQMKKRCCPSLKSRKKGRLHAWGKEIDSMKQRKKGIYSYKMHGRHWKSKTVAKAHQKIRKLFGDARHELYSKPVANK